MALVLFVLIVIWFACGFVAAVINKDRGRPAVAGLFAGWLFGPLGIIMTLLTIPKIVKSGAGKQCPDCGELVRAEARICRHCRHTFAVKAAAV